MTREELRCRPHSLVTRSLSVAAPDGLSSLSAELHPRLDRACPDDASRAGRLRVTREYSHEPVMVDEIVAALTETPQGVIVDATVGGGGHAAALLEASNSHRLIGIDRDPAAVEAARSRLAPFGGRVRIVRGRFDQIAEVIEAEAPTEPVTGFLFDLGVSSWQFDEADRGFSYRFDAPLDMRMDPDQELTAADIVNKWPQAALEALLLENGETRFARRIARAIVEARPVQTTSELAELARAALPGAAKRRGGHPAKRVFQAIRIAVNSEAEQLPVALEAALSALAPGGRVAVLSYHSGEDRTVKQIFAEAAAGWCTCPAGLPCVCGAVPMVNVLTRGARLPSEDEVSANPRASSARLRIAERLDQPWRRPGESKEAQ